MRKKKYDYPLSFESHVIEDVIKKTDGKYTYEQICDVLHASISYAINLCLYTDNVRVKIPFIGEMVCNVREMERRKHNLERLISKGIVLYPYQKKELEVLGKKIEDIRAAQAAGEINPHSLLLIDRMRNLKLYRRGYSYSDIQKIQEEEFNS